MVMCMSVTVEGLKIYLRIDGNDEDDLLESFLMAAESYIRNAISNFDTLYSNERFAAQADLLTTVLVAEMFFNRDARNDTRPDFSFATRSMINQLQYFTAGDSG